MKALAVVMILKTYIYVELLVGSFCVATTFGINIKQSNPTLDPPVVLHLLSGDAPKLPSFELNSLWDLYNATRGTDWMWESNGMIWDFINDPNPCRDHWQGIGCIGASNNSINVYNITLQGYLLNGTLPESMGVFSQLHTLALDNNTLLYGNIPQSIGNLTRLRLLGLSVCALSGTIPESLTQLRGLGSLNMSVNRLEGTLPQNMNNLVSLQYLLLYVNSLSGTIPAALGSLTHLRVVCLQSNDFTGVLPASLSVLPSLVIISTSKNMLTGPMPSITGSVHTLQFLDLSFNMLTGTVGSDWAGFSRLSFIFLDNNLFTGSLSPSLNSLTFLQTLSIYSNLLVGPLTDVFNASSQHLISTIDVSDNQFSGDIPSSFFAMRKLKSLSAGKNCLHGSIPDAVCNMTALVVLSFDGLMTATTCQEQFFPPSWGIGTYKIARQISGGVPSCLFSLPIIKSVHLSGNGLGGKIIPLLDSVSTNTTFDPFGNIHSSAIFDDHDDASEMTISASLVDLSLSYNSLTGTIPLSIQQHTWVHLDLSNNRLSGTIDEAFPPLQVSQQIKLQINRLSGVLPQSIVSALNIDILEGNVFSCDFYENNLPQHDTYVRKYACGSNAFNYSTYIWIMVFGAFVITIGAAKLNLNRQERIQFEKREKSGNSIHKSVLGDMIDKINVWLSVLVENSTKYLGDSHAVIVAYKNQPNVLSFARLLKLERISSFSITIVLIVLALPAYCILSTFFSTFTHEYAWTVSAVYLTGYVPCIILVYLFSLVSWMCCYYHNEKRKIRVNNHKIVADRSSARITSVNVGSSAALDIQSQFSGGSNSQQHGGGNTSSINSDNNTTTSKTLLTKSFFRSFSHLPWFVYTCMLFIVLLDIVVVLTVNIVYTFLFQTSGANVVFLLQVAVAVFKILWNSFIIPALLKWMFVILASVQNQPQRDQTVGGNDVGTSTSDNMRSSTTSTSSSATINTTSSQSSSSAHSSTAFSESSFAARVTLELFITLFNNIAATFVATSLFNPNCFYHVIALPSDQTAPSVTCAAFQTTPNGLECATFDLVTRETSYTPPFMYNYQCASTIITSYANIYVYMFLITTFVDPLIEVCWKVMYDRVIKSRGKEDFTYRLFSSLLPKLLKPVHLLLDIQNDQNDDVNEIRTLSDAFRELFSPRGNKHTLFESDYFAVQVLQTMSILLTFGVIMPPLAVFACVALWSKTIICQLVVGRFIFVCCSDSRVVETKALLNTLEQDFIRFSNVLVDSEWIVTPFVVVFYALLLFDTLGDQIGWLQAMWLPLVICALPVFAYLTKLVVLFVYNKHKDIINENMKSMGSVVQVEVEMSSVANILRSDKNSASMDVENNKS